MEGISLKHYQRYRRNIQKYADAVGIKIKVSPTDTEGVWSEARREVRIDEDMDESIEIAVLLHELGHALDVFLMLRPQRDRLAKHYRAIDLGTCTKSQLAEVIRCEKRAWAIGRVLAKQLRIPLGRWYTRVADECLKSYRE